MSAQCPGFVVTFYDASSISTGLKSRFDYSSTISTCLKETRFVSSRESIGCRVTHQVEDLRQVL
eukprot:m.228412 g.228412  ORF g.228412 m.228412 type:complete len:64 (-) comp15670_c0_seq2:780-971(-)